MRGLVKSFQSLWQNHRWATIGTAAGVGSKPVGTYLYVAILQWRDDAGNVYRLFVQWQDGNQSLIDPMNAEKKRRFFSRKVQCPPAELSDK